MSVSKAGFGFSIRPVKGGWSWAAIDPAGEIRAKGAAPTKALAAAFVIRAIAQSISEEGAPV